MGHLTRPSAFRSSPSRPSPCARNPPITHSSLLKLNKQLNIRGRNQKSNTAAEIYGGKAKKAEQKAMNKMNECHGKKRVICVLLALRQWLCILTSLLMKPVLLCISVLALLLNALCVSAVAEPQPQYKKPGVGLDSWTQRRLRDEHNLAPIDEKLIEIQSFQESLKGLVEYGKADGRTGCRVADGVDS
jgi:hypothetical protein